MLYTIKVYLLLIWRTSSYISYIKKKDEPFQFLREH